jgi:hypothetical protein
VVGGGLDLAELAREENGINGRVRRAIGHDVVRISYTRCR